MRIPLDITTAIDACFAANICFDLAVVIKGVPFRIVSDSASTAKVINQYGQKIGTITKD